MPNPDCGQNVNIDNTALHGEIIAILIRMINEPSVVVPKSIPCTDQAPKYKKSKNDVDQDLNNFEFNKYRVKDIIFAQAKETYRHIDNRQCKARAAREKSQ